jgi:alanyl-tRNA synthetase
MDEKKQLERQLSDAKKQAALGGGAGGSPAASAMKDIAGVNYLPLNLAGVDTKDLKSLAEEKLATVGSGVVAVANAGSDGKLGIVVAVTKDLTAKYSAVDLVRVASESVGGKGGGGRPDMAQAGGPDGAKAGNALDAIEARIGAGA